MTFADAIAVNTPAGTAEARLFVAPGADYLLDHFPGAPMLPGLVMLEAAVRAAAALCHARHASSGPEPTLDRVDRLHVLRRVLPGETLRVRADLVEATTDRHTACFSARADVAGETAMRARFRLRLPDRPLNLEP